MPSTPKSQKSTTDLPDRLVNLAKNFLDKSQYFKKDKDISAE